MISYEDFTKVDIRVGTIIEVHSFPEARKPAFKLVIDFGPAVGKKRSSAQITHLYKDVDLVGKQIIAVVNFPPKQIGTYMSEVLVLGLSNQEDQIVLVTPDTSVPNGQKLH